MKYSVRPNLLAREIGGEMACFLLACPYNGTTPQDPVICKSRKNNTYISALPESSWARPMICVTVSMNLTGWRWSYERGPTIVSICRPHVRALSEMRHGPTARL